MKQITILGATGSIGRQTLDIIRLYPEAYKVYALSAHQNVQAMLQQCLEFEPRFAVMVNPQAAEDLKGQLSANRSKTQVLSGSDALEIIASAPEVDSVMAAIVGASGLLSSLAAARAGKTILLANKEALIMSGRLFMETVEKHGATLLPVDSEHNAVMQCWHGKREAIRQVVLTASGGPFLGWAKDKLASVTPEQAVAHPNWSMGQKISVDSATMMNKGLEVIEASYLFNLPMNKIDVSLHPQSIAHAMVEYIDGSVLTHMGHHDMRVAISYTLGFPERIASGAPRLNLLQEAVSLDFRPIKPGEFECFDLCLKALAAGESAIIALNAANEVAVNAFLNKTLPYLAIPKVIEATMNQTLEQAVISVDDILAIDQQARRTALSHIKRTLQEPQTYV